MRDLLVHGYGKVDDARVVEILRERVEALATFRAALARAPAVDDTNLRSHRPEPGAARP